MKAVISCIEHFTESLDSYNNLNIMYNDYLTYWIYLSYGGYKGNVF